MRRVLASWLVTAAVAAIGGCAAEESSLPAGPPIVEVTMTENRFQYPKPVPAGRVIFVVRNAGRAPHRLILLPLPRDFPPIDEQVRGKVRRTMAPYAGIPTRAPGVRGTFAVDLVPGQRYAMVCFVVDKDRKTHAQKGMTSEFRPPGEPPTTEAPTTAPSTAPLDTSPPAPATDPSTAPLDTSPPAPTDTSPS